MEKIDLQLMAAHKKYLIDSLDEVKFCKAVMKILADNPKGELMAKDIVQGRGMSWDKLKGRLAKL